ncbi:DUF4105 domain-containing protein [Arenibacter sp. GZD96]|uniref:lipoprotein N-acyltransferase Lnb domain-containing protein n=1 Tax=Aurantibrevibacter litoralis TaxID=3106030 RepID=UPI002AFEA89D|nr:DUF4105 domain-containing protein [Arenibacter sp. GZD-96]MEA1785023.1 DUF4105 domain-containing protein [Arenibacter sp. GZD-96]
MTLKKRLLLCFIGCWALGYSQQVTLSPAAKISLITCGSGEELYATFGHSAFRVFDPILEIDVVYNYGTFDFNTPHFYLKFTQGKLLYSLSRQPFAHFIYEYEVENRWVKEQLLQLDASQTAHFFTFLETNYRPENRDYKYDFLFDNCATKMGEVLVRTFGDALRYDYTHLKEQYTFRELIHQNLKTNSWSAFGIDLALGSVIDRTATPQEHLFLPNYVMRQMQHATLGAKPLVLQERTILEEKGQETRPSFWLSPLFWLSLLLGLVLGITYRDYRKNTQSRWLDFILFFTTGLAGFVILFLWFLSEHTTTVSNFNVLWAFPLNIIVAFFLFSKRAKGSVLGLYMMVLCGLLLLALLLWVLKIQVFSPLLLLLLTALGLRYVFLHFHFKKAGH